MRPMNRFLIQAKISILRFIERIDERLPKPNGGTVMTAFLHWKKLPSLYLKSASVVVLALVFLGGSSRDRVPEFIESALEISFDDRTTLTWDDEHEMFAKELRRAFALPMVQSRPYADWIIEAADRQDLDRYVLASLIAAESDFAVVAKSSVGAYGPAQIRRELWADFCYTADLNHPADNISCAAQIVTHLRDRCGSLVCALKSYNVGYKNRSNAYFVAAGNRYVDKIEQNLTKLEKSFDL